MWQGLQMIAEYKGKPSHELPSDSSLSDEIHLFSAHFEASNTEPCMNTPTVRNNYVITLSEADVIKTFKQVNIHKVQGQTNYQNGYSEYALTSRQVSSLTFLTSP
jgi:hypothetical protein